MRPIPAPFAGLAVLAVFFLHVAPASAQPSTGDQKTYLIELQAGVNLVSIPVVPDVTTMSTVVADILPDVSLVQDDRGRHAIPSLEIDDVETWEWSEAYKIHTTSPVTLLVQGSEIIPDLSPMILNEGAHWIPYLRNEALPVEEALATILPSLNRVEDENGHVYEPGNQGSSLDSLHVGRGYRVWLTQRDTLRYPVNRNIGGGATVEVNTMAQALALRGLEPGQEVEVLGYYAPGDGGGGRFVVESSGAATDGGLVHVPDEHTSNPITEVINNNSIHEKPFSLPGNSKLVYGSLTADFFHPDSGTEIATIDGSYFHGHAYISKFVASPLINYKRGSLDDERNRLLDWCEDVTGSRLQCDLRVTYRRTTSDIRLRRLNVQGTLNVDWFGARVRADDPSFDNQPVIAHVMNVANELNENTPGAIDTVLLSSFGVYEYFGSLQIGKGLTLKGAGGTRLATVTNDLGHTYQPVRIKSNHTALRVRAGEALKHIRMNKSSSHPSYLEPDVKHRLSHRESTINVAPGAMRAGIADIVLDGNWEENQGAWTEGWSTYEERELYMRNTPSWSAFVSTSFHNVNIPIGQELSLQNVAVQGYGAAALLGNANTVWNTENVRISDTVWNHHMYQTHGSWTNLTLAGFSWGYAAFYVGEMENLVFEDGEPNPYRFSPEAINIRGGDAYADEDLIGNDPYNEYTRTDGTLLELGTTIDGFYMDLRESGVSVPFGGIGPRLSFRNGRLVRDDMPSAALFSEFANGYQKALYPDYTFENITIYDYGAEGTGRLLGPAHITNSSVRNVVLSDEFLDSDVTGNHTLYLRAYWRDHYAWDESQVVSYEDIQSSSPRYFVAVVDIHNNAAGADYFVTNSSFNNVSPNNTIFRNDNGNGRLSDLEGDPDKLRVFMDGVEFNMASGSFENLEMFFTLGRMQNCTDARTGRTSEDAGTLTFTASGGETRIEFPTNLLWVPLRSNYTSVTEGTGAGGLLESFEYRAPDGSPLGEDQRGPRLRINLTRALNPGEQVTFSWEAAVRPWEGGVSRPTGPTYGSNNPLTRENGR